MMDDIIDSLLKEQADFAKELIDFSNGSEEYKESITNELLTAMIEECIEARRCIHWKRWKQKTHSVDTAALKEELIDIFCFLLELFVLWNMSSKEIQNIYLDKMKTNYERRLV